MQHVVEFTQGQEEQVAARKDVWANVARGLSKSGPRVDADQHGSLFRRLLNPKP